MSGSFPTRRYPDWIQQYLRYTEHSEAPDTFHFWTAVSVVAGALRRRVWIDQRYFQWTPNFYIVFVAPPGVATKSTSVEIGMRLLRQLEGIHFGPNSLTWQGLTVALAESTAIAEFGDKILQMSCLTIPLSELGTFLKPKDTDLVDVLVDLWDGQLKPWRHRTKGDGATTIVNPWMNIIGCVTPSWLRSNFPIYMIEGGLASRIIFLYADAKRQFVPYPADVIRSDSHDAMAQMLVEDLAAIGSLVGEYSLTSEAKAWGIDWYEKHWRFHIGNASSEKLSGYLSRKQTHIHKLAMVLSASRRNELVITHHELMQSAAMISAVEKDLERIMRAMGSSDNGRIVNELTMILEAGRGWLSHAEFTKLALPRMDYRSLMNAIEGMKQANLIKMEIGGAPPTIGYRLVNYQAPQSDTAG